MRVAVRGEPFDPWAEVSAHLHAHPEHTGKYGATAIFIGSLRDFNEGREVADMTLEHYPGMTERYLERIAGEACSRWEVVDVLVVHRYGRLQLNDPIVLVAVWSAHRHNAFEACRYIIDILKTKAPFWKQERTEQGLRWVSPQE